MQCGQWHHLVMGRLSAACFDVPCRMLLVQNVEDVDAVISALTRYRHSFVDRKLFKQLLLEVMGSRAKTAHIDLLWQAFDR